MWSTVTDKTKEESGDAKTKGEGAKAAQASKPIELLFCELISTQTRLEKDKNKNNLNS